MSARRSLTRGIGELLRLLDPGLSDLVRTPQSELVAMEQPDYQFTHQQLVLLADALGIQYKHLTD